MLCFAMFLEIIQVHCVGVVLRKIMWAWYNVKVRISKQARTDRGTLDISDGHAITNLI